MIRSLSVRDVVLIDDLSLELEPGFTVVTGETGAGKSALVGAFSLLLGQRGGRELVRRGASSADVSAVFARPADPDLERVLRDAGLEPDDELVLRRVIGDDGRSRAFVDAVPVPLKLLEEVAGRLVSVTSQHEHYRLLDARAHAGYLDRFGGCDGLARDVADTARRLRTVDGRIRELDQRAQARADRLDLLRFQAAEIDDAAPVLGEDEALEARQRALQHVEELKALAHAAVGALHEDDDALYGRVAQVAQPLRRAVGLDARLEEPVRRLDALRDDVREVALELERYFDALEGDPEELARVVERLDRLNALRFKYGRTLPDVVAYRAQIGRELDDYGSADAGLEVLRREHAQLGGELAELAGRLSTARRAAASRLEEGVQGVLAQLQMPAVRVEVALEPLPEPGEDGAERVSLRVETNPGEGLRPLRDVVSGGELSRLLLALKRVLLGAEPVPLSIFDEVDAGISQSVAVRVGGLLADIAEGAQVLAITHHPHIARFARHHLLVEKVGGDGERTVTRVRPLRDDERVAELARMLGGDDAGLPVHQQAELLLRT
jgi:DNA repair protein RecN (Recombination protein N)